MDKSVRVRLEPRPTSASQTIFPPRHFFFPRTASRHFQSKYLISIKENNNNITETVKPSERTDDSTINLKEKNQKNKIYVMQQVGSSARPARFCPTSANDQTQTQNTRNYSISGDILTVEISAIHVHHFDGLSALIKIFSTKNCKNVTVSSSQSVLGQARACVNSGKKNVHREALAAVNL